MMDTLQFLAINAVPFLLAVILHEVAHGVVAFYFGDRTAKREGRLTLNPVSHIDPVGSIVVPAACYLLNVGFLWGWAKPVPVNPWNFREPRQDMFWVALAGPMSNFLQIVVWALILKVLYVAGAPLFFLQMASAGVVLNALFALFNLIPVLPLDGGRVLMGLLPESLARPFAKTEAYGFLIVLALLLGGVFDSWLQPMIAAIQRAVLQFVVG